jgi:hypothetical protein
VEDPCIVVATRHTIYYSDTFINILKNLQSNSEHLEKVKNYIQIYNTLGFVSWDGRLVTVDMKITLTFLLLITKANSSPVKCDLFNIKTHTTHHTTPYTPPLRPLNIYTTSYTRPTLHTIITLQNWIFNYFNPV